MTSHLRCPAIGVVAAAIGLWLSSAASAQTSFAALGGRVTDEQGGSLPGATIALRQVETNTTRTGTTESRGQYYLPNLPAGRYEVTVELQGFASAKREIVLRVGQEATLDVGLTIAAVAETVMDTFDRIQRDDLVQMSIVLANFAYNTAMHDKLLPRKPLPPPTGTRPTQDR